MTRIIIIDYKDGIKKVKETIGSVESTEKLLEIFEEHNDYSVKFEVNPKNDFEEYVEKWMNKKGAYGIIEVLEHGVQQSAQTNLCYTEYARDMLRKHINDIEEIVEDIANNFGNDFYDSLFRERLDLTKLVIIAFEETLRKFMIELEIEDV